MAHKIARSIIGVFQARERAVRMRSVPQSCAALERETEKVTAGLMYRPKQDKYREQ